MATMKEIAVSAGVSVSTVSKALRDANDIGAATRARIKEIAADFGYTYRSSFKPPRYSSGCNIGIICPEVISNYYSRMLTSMESVLRKEGYSALISVSAFSGGIESKLLKLYLDLGLDGIICITEGRAIQPRLDSLFLDHRMPFVLVANQMAVHEFDYIEIDDVYAVRIAIEHLTGLGHTTIGYIGDHLSRERKETYLKLLKEMNLPVVDDYVVENEEGREDCGYAGMQSILSLDRHPTAVFCAYDTIAIGALRAAYQHGVGIPNELSIISIDNVSEAGFLYRSLTTVSGPILRMGKIAAEILIDQIESKDIHVVQHITLKPHLVVRETTARPNRPVL